MPANTPWNMHGPAEMLTNGDMLKFGRRKVLRGSERANRRRVAYIFYGKQDPSDILAEFVNSLIEKKGSNRV